VGNNSEARSSGMAAQNTGQAHLRLIAAERSANEATHFAHPVETGFANGGPSFILLILNNISHETSLH
jgi:hypothetical protein